MKSILRNLGLLTLLLTIIGLKISAQDKVIDQVVSIVGRNIILKSDIEALYLQRQAQGAVSDGDMKCVILEDLLVEKLMVAQAELDTTIIVTPSQINRSMDEQMQRFLSHVGTEKELEKYFGKPITKIKSDMEEMIRNQLLTQQMQQKVIGDVTVTPSEVRYYYRNLSDNEKPIVQEQFEYAHITMVPKVPEAEELRVKTKLRELKKRIEKGESFATMAILYSEDGAARNGGELGYLGRAQLDDAYAAAAFNLKGDRVSNVVKSEFGYHILQVIDRKGDKINTRHIIMKPKVDTKELEKAYNMLDTISDAIRKKEISFQQAAYYYSQDKSTKNNGGLVVNPMTMASRFEIENISPQDSKVLTNIKIGEISEPFEAIDQQTGVKVVKIVKLINKTDKHKANLTDDYKMLSDMYLMKKREEEMDKWIQEEQADTYITIDDSYVNCNFKFENWIK